MGTLRAILGLDVTPQMPTVRSTIPTALGGNGLPIIFTSDDPIDYFYLIHYEKGTTYSLPTSWLQYYCFDDSDVFYEADEDIVAYLEGEGYTFECGDYYYKFVSSGRIKYSQVFHMERFTILPEILGDYDGGFNLDFR